MAAAPEEPAAGEAAPPGAIRAVQGREAAAVPARGPVGQAPAVQGQAAPELAAEPSARTAAAIRRTAIARITRTVPAAGTADPDGIRRM